MKIEDMENGKLVENETRLRDQLQELSGRSEAYARKYKAWFMLRESGVNRGIYKSFIPSVTRRGK